MIRFLIPLILLTIVVIMARRYVNNSTTAAQKKSRKITVALMAFALIMILLALFHRMHWVGAALAVIAPFARLLISSLVDRLQKGKISTTTNATPSNNELTEDEALQILGLQKPFTSDDVIEAHRKLMQKFHPDRGGNDYLASRINQAKELLLK